MLTLCFSRLVSVVHSSMGAKMLGRYLLSGGRQSIFYTNSRFVSAKTRV